MNVFVFDIETVPDVASGRRLYGDAAAMKQLSDEDVARVMLQHYNQNSANPREILRHHLHRIIAISVVLRSGDTFKVWSLGEVDSPEAELIRRFFDGLQRYTPTLVSWNGGGFDLPVLHYRTLLHGINASRYWETHGDFRYNNYLNRYHERHTDLMDVLAAYQPNAFVSLHEAATLLGFPGKLGMHGDQVWAAYLQGQIQAIRQYCETDVLNTYLIYLRFELIRGNLNESEYTQECQRVRERLILEGKPHFTAFLEAWDSLSL